MDTGSRELTRLVTAYAASGAFGITFLWATWSGCGGTTALLRGVVAVVATMLVAQLLAVPVVHVVLDAMARDTAKQAAMKKDGDD